MTSDYRFNVGERVLIGDYLNVVPDDADEKIALNPSAIPATVVEVQEDATLIMFSNHGGRIFAVMGDERERLRPYLHGGSPERKAELDAKAEQGRIMRQAQDYDVIRDEVLAKHRGRLEDLTDPQPTPRQSLANALEVYASEEAATVTHATLLGEFRLASTARECRDEALRVMRRVRERKTSRGSQLTAEQVGRAIDAVAFGTSATESFR